MFEGSSIPFSRTQDQAPSVAPVYRLPIIDHNAKTIKAKQQSVSVVAKRQTLKNAIACTGIGLHSGKRVSMTLVPAEPNTGIVFVRSDLKDAPRIPAVWQSVRDTRLCTVIGSCDAPSATVATIEHLMAALSACGIDDLEIEINGPEIPAMDGSSAPFVFLIECAGIAVSSTPRMAWKVMESVSVGHNGSTASLVPWDAGLRVDFEIEFAAAAIGRQSCTINVTPADFKAALMRARTFGLLEDLPKMRAAGLGLGGSLDNAVVVDGDRVLNEDGLRYPDEFVRHKALDAIGDLALAGHPIIGHYTGLRSSHATNAALVQALFSRPGAAVLVPMMADDGRSSAPIRVTA